MKIFAFYSLFFNFYVCTSNKRTLRGDVIKSSSILKIRPRTLTYHLISCQGTILGGGGSRKPLKINLPPLPRIKLRMHPWIPYKTAELWCEIVNPQTVLSTSLSKYFCSTIQNKTSLIASSKKSLFSGSKSHLSYIIRQFFLCIVL